MCLLCSYILNVVAFTGIVGTAVTMACGNGIMWTLIQAEASVALVCVIQLVGGRFLWVRGEKKEEKKDGGNPRPSVFEVEIGLFDVI